MIAGPMPCVIVATWPSGIVVGAPFGPGTTQRQLRAGPPRAAAPRARAAPSTSRVSPVGSTQSPASMPANAGRSDCATCPTVTPSEPARPRLSSTSSSGFCPLRREADVHRARHLLDLRRTMLGAPALSAARSLPAQLELDLLAAAAEVAREHRHRRAGDLRRSRRAASARELLGADRLRSFFGTSADVDVALVHRAGRAAAERRVGVPHFRLRARDARRFLRLEPRVLEVRARRRLDRDDELGAVVLGKKPTPTVRTGGTTRGSMTNIATPTTTTPTRARIGSRCVDRQHDDRDAERARQQSGDARRRQHERREERPDRDRRPSPRGGRAPTRSRCL